MHGIAQPQATAWPVVALHCSGAGPSQWHSLATALGPAAILSTPSYFGSQDIGPWPGTHAFTLADEARLLAGSLDRAGEKIHLVGHSYGGALALHIAAQRPGRIASLALYEPSAFHLLRLAGDSAAAAFAEIATVSRQTAALVSTGNSRGAAAFFIDYWSGKGAWTALRPAIQAALMRWIVKAPLDFHALIEEPTPVDLYATLGVPILLLRGEHAPAPTRQIVDILAAALPGVRVEVIPGAGHMGALTHADTVAAAIAAHVAASATGTNTREVARRKRRREASPREVRDCLTELAGMLEGLARDTTSPLIAALQADCRVVLDGGAADLARHLIDLHGRLDEITGTGIPTVDDLRLRAVGERLGAIAAAL